MFDNQRIIELENAEMIFIEHFFTPAEADTIFQSLIEKLAWEQGEITMFGKKILEPRLTAWYGDEGKSYTYSGKKQEPNAWVEPLITLKNKVSDTCIKEETLKGGPSVPKAIGVSQDSIFKGFNSVLANFYRNGTDSMGYHSDDEKELGINPVIASVNFGESRRFQFRHKIHKEKKHELLLTHGSLLIMQGAMQHHWKHAIPKEPQKTKPRINLTFRFIM
jgi:alkylated DNA repair dioxygenase AlkB